MIHPRAGLIVALALAVTACGGGGGSDLPAPETPQPPAVPPSSVLPPSTPPPAVEAPVPFQFSPANATDAAGFVLQAAEYVSLMAQYPAVVADHLRLAGGTATTIACGGAQLQLSYEDQDANGQLSAGDVLRFVSPGCGSLAVELTFALSAIQAMPPGTAYAGPGSGFARLSGRATFDITYTPPLVAIGAPGISLAGSSKTIHSEADEAVTEALFAPFLDGDEAPSSSAPAAKSLRLRGTLALEYSASSNAQRRWVVTDVNVKLSAEGTDESLTNGRLERRTAGDDYLLDLSGTIDSQRLATRFTYSTPTFLQGLVGDFPSAGLLELVAGRSRLALAPSSDPMRGGLAVDSAGGGYGSAQPVAWTELLLGTLFGWSPNQRPIITELSISPENPTALTPLAAVYATTDPDGHRLQHRFEWRRNGEIISAQPFSTLQEHSLRKGDIVEVTLIVSDGRQSATRTAARTIGNIAPSLPLVLAPSDPTTVDDLEMLGRPADIDDDPLVVTYRWQRNGQDIPTRTGPLLPASETSRGDVITLIVTASDGTVTTVGETSLTIADSPPTLTVTGAPSSAVRGAPVQFTAALNDADGDPTDAFRFVLTHGPAGMSIDSVSGRVSWTADLPMFDRSVDVRWGVAVDEVPGSPSSGTITVTDSTREYPLMRTGTEIPVWRAGLRIGDFDADGDNEMLILSRRSLYELESTGLGYRQSWMYPFALPLEVGQGVSPARPLAMTAGDIDGDRRHEIFIAAGREILVLDGVQRRVVRSVVRDDFSSCQDLELANLDGIGAQELVCIATGTNGLNSGVLAVFGADDLALRWQAAVGGPMYGAALAIGNVDRDPALEIVTSNGAVYDGVGGTNQWFYTPGFGLDVATGDLDGDGVEEIVGAVRWAAVRGYSALLRTPMWEIAADDLAAILVTDIEGDSREEILVGAGQWGGVTAYRYDPATNSLAQIFWIDSQNHGVTDLQAGDVDNDGELEFVWGTGETSTGSDQLVVAGRNPTIAVEWINSNPSQLDGPFSGGELARSPLLAPGPLFVTPTTDSGYGGTRLVRMNVTTGDLTVTSEIGSNANNIAALAVADYDGDGFDEAFLGTSQGYDGFLSVFDVFNAAEEWRGPRSRNQIAAAVVSADVTNDGRDDLVTMSTAGVVSINDVFQQEAVWQSTSLSAGVDVIVADLDRDGIADILAVTRGHLYVYERVGGAIGYAQTANYQASSDVQDAIVVDTDGDGELEVVVLMSNSTHSRIERLDGGLQRLGYAMLEPFGELLVAETSGSSRNVIVAGNGGYGARNALVAIDAHNGEEVWRSPWLIGRIPRNAVQRVVIGGTSRFAIGTSAGMYLTR